MNQVYAPQSVHRRHTFLLTGILAEYVLALFDGSFTSLAYSTNKYVTGFAKRGLPHTFSLPNFDDS